MSKRTDEAIAHITKQAMDSGSPLLVYIEERLTEECKTDEAAEKLLDPQKSLKELGDQITKEAREKAEKGVAVISDAEVYERARQYYGLAAEPKVVDVLDLL